MSFDFKGACRRHLSDGDEKVCIDLSGNLPLIL